MRWEIYDVHTGQVIDVVMGSETQAESQKQEAMAEAFEIGGWECVEYAIREVKRSW